METINIRHEAHQLIDQLPLNATWDDLMYSIYVRQAIEKGIADSDTGQTITVQRLKDVLRSNTPIHDTKRS